MLNELAKEAHQIAVEHGWWDKEPTFGELVALMHSELSEALEEYRAGRPMVYFLEANGFVVSDMSDRRGEKLEGIAVELADCIIRFHTHQMALQWMDELTLTRSTRRLGNHRQCLSCGKCVARGNGGA